MAPLPHNNTDIYYLDYNVATHPHVLEVRTVDGAAVADVIAEIDAFMGNLNAMLTTVSFTGFRFQGNGTDVSFPVTWTGDTVWGSGAATDQQAASYCSFVGRSIDGRRAKVSVFGFKALSADVNFRFARGESEAVDNELDALGTFTNGFKSISGLDVIWNQYMNTGQNAHWRNKLR